MIEMKIWNFEMQNTFPSFNFRNLLRNSNWQMIRPHVSSLLRELLFSMFNFAKIDQKFVLLKALFPQRKL